jgi:geranylgeranyl reductase family protein
MTGQKIYDVCIVGAGPAGATCAYYLARQGHDVVMLERKRFPRDKICGDAVCAQAQVHLQRMGVLQDIIDNNEGHFAAVGGMVSPRGISYIASSVEHLKSSQVIAIKRMFLDVRIAYAARDARAELIEDYAVAAASFDAAAGLWTVTPEGGGPILQARALVAADGALSRLARRLGYVDTPPEAVCSRAYVRARTTNFEADGVVYYPKTLLPGYCAIFREARDELNFCVYVIPGGKTKVNDLRAIHHQILQHDPHVSRAIGPHAEIDEMKGAPLRLGGIARSFGDHFLIIGDAAGHIDPLTGEGIQFGMDAAEYAADTLHAALAAGDLRAPALKPYQDRWMQAFGRDFAWSAAIARFYGRFPAFLDAGALTLNRLGPPFLAEWAQIMTGAKPKTDFLKPAIWLPIMRDLLSLPMRAAT